MDIQNNPKKYNKNKYGSEKIELADPFAMAIVIEPKIILKSKKCNVDINLSNDKHRGENIIKENGVKNTTIIIEGSRKKFLDTFIDSLK